MAKKIKTIVKLQIQAGKANPAPPVGPALGQHGLAIGDFVNQFNDATKEMGSDIIPVEISVFEDRSFTFKLKTPPASDLLRKAAGVENKIKYQQLDAEDLPFPDESFDAIFMLDTLQHIKEKAKALKECMRLVRHNGIVNIFELNKDGIEYCQHELGFTPDLVVPMDFMKNNNELSVEAITGKLVNAYILRKKLH